MTRIICKNCYWGDKCPDTCGCEYYDPLHKEKELSEDKILHNREQYEYEYRAYILAHQSGNKWGDLYDYE